MIPNKQKRKTNQVDVDGREVRDKVGVCEHDTFRVPCVEKARVMDKYHQWLTQDKC